MKGIQLKLSTDRDVNAECLTPNNPGGAACFVAV